MIRPCAPRVALSDYYSALTVHHRNGIAWYFHFWKQFWRTKKICKVLKILHHMYHFWTSLNKKVETKSKSVRPFVQTSFRLIPSYLWRVHKWHTCVEYLCTRFLRQVQNWRFHSSCKSSVSTASVLASASFFCTSASVASYCTCIFFLASVLFWRAPLFFLAIELWVLFRNFDDCQSLNTVPYNYSYGILLGRWLGYIFITGTEIHVVTYIAGWRCYSWLSLACLLDFNCASLVL